jgi:superfamily II DNA helicase RecQ
MKKRIKIALVVATIVALPLMGAQQSKSEEKSLLVDFIEYCKTCENLRQVDPNKDYTQATLHELKNAARFYEEQENFADCTDYQQQAKIDEIIGKTYDARMTYGR